MTLRTGPYTVAEIASAVGGSVHGEGGEKILLNDIRPLDVADDTHLSFLDNPTYKVKAQGTRAKAVLIRAEDAAILPRTATAIVVKNPYAAFAQAMQKFYPQAEVKAGISNMAVVSQAATVDPTARIEPYAVVYAKARIGAGAHIGAHTVVGEGVEVGANTRVAPHVTLLNTTIGNNCLIQSGVRVGQDGFGFALENGHTVKIPQVGRVRIGNDVEIGANTTIDRGALTDTVIGDGTKMDCLIQIAHNVRLGKHCRIVAQTAIAGSTLIGDGVVIGGQTGIAGHLALADGVMVAARSGVTKSVDQPKAVVAGFPAMPIAQWRRLQALLSRMTKAGSKVRPGAENERAVQVKQELVSTTSGGPIPPAARVVANPIAEISPSVMAEQE
ncbi:MAG: UDP-3-O-(3-hydroxymyristoyl)glucosamine N-acyltransferase [Alphaproteobacteria bacterium]